ncbi:MAG TPA: ribonuclease R [Longimicrobiales bacterium]|nr:ribonuclease R [Longimicrobiales bacterium]
MSRDSLERRVLEILAGSRHGPMKPKDVSRALELPPERYRDLKHLLADLEADGKVYRVKGNRWALPERLDLVVGLASVTRSGDAFVRPEQGRPDVFVPSHHLGTALDGDRVVVRIEDRPRGRSPTGRIIKVLVRAHATVVGTLHRAPRFSYVVPLDRRMTREVLLPAGEEGGADDGDVVVVRLVSFGEDGAPALVGELETVLGPLSDPGVDVLAVAHSYGLSLEFPAEALRAAEEAARMGLEQAGERVDRTGLLLLTIDPADAKDHDDALSIEAVGAGRWEVGIHIADVSHFVEEGGPVDLEATVRGTSVYLVDRTVPMLPERLSGDVCSLRAGVERLAVSVFVTLDREGRATSQRMERTRVKSRHRLSYEEVQEVLDGKRSIGPDVDEALRRLDDLARAVRRHRFRRGALDLDLPETKVVLDAEGLPLDIHRIDRLEAHRLIEDFMILANEAVARACEARGLAVLYRVHEPPVRERTEELAEFLLRFGLRLPRRKRLRPSDVQALLEAVHGKPEESLVSTVVLRSLQRARYDAENLGHFGLASEAYLHFTSPIRRYPDLVVHREVVRTLVGGEPPRERDQEDLQAVADHASARERAADDAERDSVALKKVEFMERHLGDEFEGRVSSVTAFGFFVTLDAYHVDGLVHVNTLRDDFYRLAEGTYALVGDRGRRRYRIGDRVLVQVARVDKEARHVDFLLLRKLSRNV